MYVIHSLSYLTLLFNEGDLNIDTLTDCEALSR